MTTELMPSATSPFDAIRQADIAGDYWSARDLMPLLGYGADWRNFAAAIERARQAAANSGANVANLFVAVTENSGGRPRENYRLARYACYLIAMNGDPRKPEVAAAQTYFAVRTREAEVAPVALTEDQIVARALQITTQRVEALESRVAELAPRAEVADRLLDADGDLSVADAAKALTRAGIDTGATRLFSVLAGMRWIYRGGDGRWRVYQAAIESGFMAVLPQSHYHPRTGDLVVDPPQPRITPKGLERLLRDLTPEPDPVRDLQLVS